MSMRCHFNADGWLEGPIDISHHMTPNRHDSGFAAKGPGAWCSTPRTVSRLGTDATFMDPGSQVSAFFSVGEDGHHPPVPAGGSWLRGLRPGGKATRTITAASARTSLKALVTPMTDIQVTTVAQIYNALAEHDGFEYAITDDTEQTATA